MLIKVFQNVIKNSVVVAAGLFLGACAATSVTPGLESVTVTENQGRLSLADSQLGDTYAVVNAQASERYGVEPKCETRKIALQKQRKAFVYDICAYTPENHAFSEAPLAEVVYHFIERKLVRVDVRATGDSQLLDTIKADMQSVFASNGITLTQLKPASYEWVAKNQVAGVRAGSGVNTGNIHVRLLDASLNDSAPWLSSE